MRKVIEMIKAQNIPCYFISPHFDDAILSAGALIVTLSKITSVTIVTAFTKSGTKPYSHSAKSYLKQCGYQSAIKLYRDRMKEDKKVLSLLNVQQKYLSLTDALWRKKSSTLPIFIKKLVPEITYVYPTYSLHVISGKISCNDIQTIRALRKKLSFIQKDSIVFCPAGIGMHVDHVLVREVCRELFRNVIFWSDFPYNVSGGNRNILSRFQKIGECNDNKQMKRKLITGYTSQVDALFPSGISLVREEFYVEK